MNRPKGTKDVFGKEAEIKNYVLETMRTLSRFNNFKIIETPIFEHEEVFVRSVGETSDIVSKEIYSFNDKSERVLALRPEGTAGTIRAIVENKLYVKLPLKLFYEGPMFRYENPQKGRQRQFTQFGIEMLCDKNPYADLEVICLAASMLDILGIPYLLKINSLGDKSVRTAYSAALRNYFAQYETELLPISLERLKTNPLRILDDKVESTKEFVQKAPKISNFYSPETKSFFDSICSFLRKIGINFEVDQKLVRGLDYYTDTTFEFVAISGNAGSQDTLIGGGRYENLVANFEGPEIGGIGFAVGIERIVNEIACKDDFIIDQLDIFVLHISSSVTTETFALVNMLRNSGFSTEWNISPLKLNKAFEKSEQANARVVIIAGEKEFKESQVTFKFEGVQKTVKMDDIIGELEECLSYKEGEENENDK